MKLNLYKINRIFIPVLVALGTFSCLLMNPDMEPPIVFINSIESTCSEDGSVNQGMVVCEWVAINCNIQDNSGLYDASLWINGDSSNNQIFLNDAEQDYSINWDTKNYNNTSYEIEIKVYDKNGNSAKSYPLTLLVDNGELPCEDGSECIEKEIDNDIFVFECEGDGTPCPEGGAIPGRVVISNIELIDISYEITWAQSNADDFDHYMLERLDSYISDEIYIPNIICEKDSITDNICWDGDDSDEIVNPTIPNYYRVHVYDTLGFVSIGPKKLATPDPAPVPITIINSEYGSNNITLEWELCEDEDFKMLHLYQADNSFMEDEVLIQSWDDQSITSYTIENINDNETRYFRIVVEDVWGQMGVGPIFVAYSFIRFTKLFGGNMDDVGTSVKQIDDNGFIISGFTESESAGMEDGLVIHATIEGEILDQFVIGGGSRDIFNSSLIIDNNKYFVGRTESSGNGGIDGWLVMMNEEGQIIFDNSFGTSSDNQFYKIKENAEQNELLMIGETISETSSNDIWVYKTGLEGEYIDEFSIGGANRDLGRDIIPITNGYIILGETKSCGVNAIGDGINCPGNNDIWLINVNNNGDIIWEHLYGSNDYSDYARAILELEYSTQNEYYILGIHGESTGLGSICLIKTDGDGNNPEYQYLGNPGDDASDMIFTDNHENILIVGTTYRNGDADILLIKYNLSTSTTLFEKTYGGINNDRGLSVSVVCEDISGAPEGCSEGNIEESDIYYFGYIITGETQSFGAENKDLILIKTDPYGGTVTHGGE